MFDPLQFKHQDWALVLEHMIIKKISSLMNSHLLKYAQDGIGK